MPVTAGSANVRSFRPGQDKGNPFRYGLTTIDQAVSTVLSLAADGYSTIVNRDDRHGRRRCVGRRAERGPRVHSVRHAQGVEKPGAVSMPHGLALRLLKTVYGFQPDVPLAEGSASSSASTQCELVTGVPIPCCGRPSPSKEFVSSP